VIRNNTIQERDENILVWLPSPLGDAIMCTPALRAIRKHFESARITFLAKRVIRQVLSPSRFNDSWLENNIKNPLATAKVLKQHGFTHAVLFKNSFASAFSVRLAGIRNRIGYSRESRGLLLTDKLHPERLANGKFKPGSMVDYYLAVASRLGAEVNDKGLELSINEQDKKTLLEKLPALTDASGPIIILVPGGAFGPSKCWPSDRFAQTADRLIADYNATVVISVASTPAEQEIARQISAASKYSQQDRHKDSNNRLISLADIDVSLGELKPLIAMADLVITNDTGPRHIAAALQRKVITVFGSSNPAWTDTGYEKEIRIISDVPCAPCHKKVCPLEHQCMTGITVEQVLDAAKTLLSKD
jgi:heptosyltransferase-2